MVKVHYANLPEYPSWCCNECGKAAALATFGKVPDWGCSTFHRDICPICTKDTFVTEPRDYRYPDFSLLQKQKTPDEIREKIGLGIRFTRQSRKVSQKELSKLLGYSTPLSVSFFERGIRPVKAETLIQMAYVLKCNVSDFFLYI